MDQVLPPLAKHLSQSLLISIAAGKPLRFFQRIFGQDARLVRAMPNLPAAIGAGATGWVAGPNLGAKDRAITQDLLSATGWAKELEDEAQIDAWTAISGSRPRLCFHFMRNLAGCRSGLWF